MAGFTVGQPFSHGHTEQSTLVPGQATVGAAPAAGASYSYVVSRHDRVRLVFCTFALTTSATVANRYVTVEYLGGDGVGIVADGAAVVVTASTTAQRFVGALHRGPAEWNTGTDVFFPLSGIWLEAGQTVKINVAAIDTTDALTNIRLTFDRLLVQDDPLRDPKLPV